MVKTWACSWEMKHWSWDTWSVWWWILLWRNSPPAEMITKLKTAQKSKVRANLFLCLSMSGLSLLEDSIGTGRHCQYIMLPTARTWSAGRYGKSLLLGAGCCTSRCRTWKTPWKILCGTAKGRVLNWSSTIFERKELKTPYFLKSGTFNFPFENHLMLVHIAKITRVVNTQDDLA